MREEIALAKAELSEKISGLVKGAAVGAAAGIFIVAGLIYFLHFLALLIAELLGDTWWLGYLIVAGGLFLFGGIAGFLAARFFKKGTPPTPQMAIEEAQLIKATHHLAAPGHARHRRRAGGSVEPRRVEADDERASARRRRSGARSRPTASSSASPSRSCAARSRRRPTGAASCARTSAR